MNQTRVDMNGLRMLPDGSCVAVVYRWPKELVERMTPPLAALIGDEEEGHDGWQAVRPRMRPLVASAPQRERSMRGDA